MTPWDIAELSDYEFSLLGQLVYDRSGIQLFQHKQTLVRNRLSRRLRALGLSTFLEYYEFLVARGPQEPEFDRMLDAICTHVTGFFREPDHFEYLARTFYPQRAKTSQLRILSAGCSTGEEPYSIAMCLREACVDSAGPRIDIQAVDLSTSTLHTAEAAIYDRDRVQHLPAERLRRFFLNGQGRHHNKVRVVPEIRALIEFQAMNLIRPSGQQGTFDAIFCRNVIIYFDRPTQLKCFRWFYDHLAPGGILFLGHSESLIGSNQAFTYVQPTVYQRQG